MSLLHRLVAGLVAAIAGWRLLIQMEVVPAATGEALQQEWWVVPLVLFVTTYASTRDLLLSSGVTGGLLYLVETLPKKKRE